MYSVVLGKTCTLDTSVDTKLFNYYTRLHGLCNSDNVSVGDNVELKKALDTGVKQAEKALAEDKKELRAVEQMAGTVSGVVGKAQGSAHKMQETTQEDLRDIANDQERLSELETTVRDQKAAASNAAEKLKNIESTEDNAREMAEAAAEASRLLAEAQEKEEKSLVHEEATNETLSASKRVIANLTQNSSMGAGLTVEEAQAAFDLAKEAKMNATVLRSEVVAEARDTPQTSEMPSGSGGGSNASSAGQQDFFNGQQPDTENGTNSTNSSRTRNGTNSSSPRNGTRGGASNSSQSTSTRSGTNAITSNSTNAGANDTTDAITSNSTNANNVTLEQASAAVAAAREKMRKAAAALKKAEEGAKSDDQTIEKAKEMGAKFAEKEIEAEEEERNDKINVETAEERANATATDAQGVNKTLASLKPVIEASMAANDTVKNSEAKAGALKLQLQVDKQEYEEDNRTLANKESAIATARVGQENLIPSRTFTKLITKHRSVTLTLTLTLRHLILTVISKADI